MAAVAAVAAAAAVAAVAAAAVAAVVAAVAAVAAALVLLSACPPVLTCAFRYLLPPPPRRPAAAAAADYDDDEEHFEDHADHPLHPHRCPSPCAYRPFLAQSPLPSLPPLLGVFALPPAHRRRHGLRARPKRQANAELAQIRGVAQLRRPLVRRETVRRPRQRLAAYVQRLAAYEQLPLNQSLPPPPFFVEIAPP